MKGHQKFVEQKLLKTGRISRNYALRHYVSRLAAIIIRLKAKYEIEGKAVKTKNGEDYVYTLVK